MINETLLNLMSSSNLLGLLDVIKIPEHITNNIKHILKDYQNETLNGVQIYNTGFI